MLTTLTKYIFAIIIIIVIFWTRFFRDREHSLLLNYIPKEWIIVSNFCLIIFFCLIFYINIKKILKIKKESLLIKKIFDSLIVQNLITIIREYVLNSPKYLYTQITKNIDLRPILEKPASYFTAYCRYPKFITLVFIELPLTIVSTSFLISVIYYQNLHYFFISLILLIPVLFMRIWLFVLENYSQRRLDHLSLFLNVFYIVNENQYKIELKSISDLPVMADFTIPQIQYQFPVLCNFWEIYSQIYSFIKHIDSYCKYYEPYIQVYTSFCYIIGWSYYLFLIL